MTEIAPYRRRLVLCHGIAAGADHENFGYGDPLVATMLDVVAGVRGFESWRPDVFEVHYSTRINTLEVDGEAEGLLDGLLDAIELGILDIARDYIRDVFTYSGRANRRALEGHIAAQVDEAVAGCDGPIVLACHSLGSIACGLASLNRWLTSGAISADVPRRDWPCDTLVLFGSPCRIVVPGRPDIGYLDRAVTLSHAPTAPAGFTFLDYADRNDPVVSGSWLGCASSAQAIESLHGYARHGARTLWVDTGHHLLSHTAYWSNTALAARLVAAIAAPLE